MPVKPSIQTSIQVHAKQFPIGYCDWMGGSLGCVQPPLPGDCVSECVSVCFYCARSQSPVSVGAKVSTDPGSPPASITFASVTSFDQTSYCHFLRPSTPHSTRPVCRPTRMFRSTSVASTTDLKGGDGVGRLEILKK